MLPLCDGAHIVGVSTEAPHRPHLEGSGNLLVAMLGDQSLSSTLHSVASSLEVSAQLGNHLGGDGEADGLEHGGLLGW